MQPGRDGVGQVDGDPGGAVAEPGGDQAGAAPGPAFLLGQLLGLVLLDDLRREDLEDPAAQDPQLARTEVRRLGDQVGLGPGEQVGGDLLGGQLLQGVGDHPRLGHVEVALTERRRHHGPAPVQRFGECQVAPVGAEVAAGVLGDQRGHVAGTLGQRDVVGDRHHPQLQRGQLRLETGQPQQRRPLVPGVHEGDLHISGLLQRRRDRLGTRQHRVHVAVEGRAHHAPPTSTTDHWVSRVDAARL